MRRSLRFRSAALAALLVVLTGGLGASGTPAPTAVPAPRASAFADLVGSPAPQVALGADAEPGPLTPTPEPSPALPPAPTPTVLPAEPAPTPPPTAASATARPAARPVVAAGGALSQPGCPLPPRPPRPARPDPGLPSGLTLVPEAQVPEAPAPPTGRTIDAAMAAGRGMWTWQWNRTEGGDLGAVVRRAKAAGLSTLWVRVADSKSGFYGAKYLDGLVPAAHREGIKVVGWGFPFLGDPVADAAWTAQVLAWQKDGHRLDAYSPDLETGSEGVVVTEKRLATYLGLTRQALAGRPLIATVYNPTDTQWARYPYALVASYADALAPMVYWGCRDPGADVERAVRRLTTLGRPVIPVGQAYDMATDGGRAGSPTAAETVRFLDQARRSGAVGASFWVWQEASAEQWQAISAYPW